MFGELAAVIAPVVICAGIGFLWARMKRPFETEFVAVLVTQVATPCLVASTLTRLELELDALAAMAGAAVAVFAIVAAISVAGLRAAGRPLHSYLPALLFPNAGNMGLPLCLFAFGEAGLALAIVFFAVSSTLQFTAGVGIAAGSFAPGRLARVPLLYALAIALVLMITDTKLPAWIANTIELVGNITIPLMLIALGVSLARLGIRSLKTSLVIALARLVLGFLVALAVIWAMSPPDAVAKVLLIQSSMPVAVFNYLFAQVYKRRPEEIAGAVVLSTLISFATLPLLLLLVL